MSIKRSDWVVTKARPHASPGFVKRVARDGSWADVKWSDGVETWTKRMPTSALEVRTTIHLGDGWVVTDLGRARETDFDYLPF